MTNAPPKRCTLCNWQLEPTHEGLPLCSRCERQVRKSKREKEIASIAKRPEQKEPGIREFFVHDLCVG
jgi:predicted amidophosphoribosyltransferase